MTQPDPVPLSARIREAISAANAAWVTSLLEEGASVEVEEDRSSPLAHALAHCALEIPTSGDASRGPADIDQRVEVVRVLLEAGARVYCSDSVLGLAAATGCVALVDLLLERGEDVNAKDEWEGRGFTPLHVAAAAGHEAVARRLLDGGAAPMARSQHDDTPLHCAARFGRVEVVRLLLARGALPSARSHTSDSGLHMAAARGHTSVVKVLLEAGAAVDVEPGRDSPLHLAAKGSHVEIVHLLLAAGANVAAPTYRHEGTREAIAGFTALHFAAEKEDLQVCKALILGGADWLAKTADGRTPRAMARKGGFIQAIDAMVATR